MVHLKTFVWPRVRFNSPDGLQRDDCDVIIERDVDIWFRLNAWHTAELLIILRPSISVGKFDQ